MRQPGTAALLVLTLSLGMLAQDAPSKVDALYRPLDQLLDLYVRDGFVYYNALKIERGGLDRFLASLDGPAAVAQAKGTPAAAARVLDQRLQRDRAAHGDRQLSDPRPLVRISGRQRAPDLGRLRAADAPRGGPDGHAGRHREGRSRAARRPARVSRPRARRDRRRPAAQRGLRRRHAGRAAGEDCRRIADA